MDTVSTGSVDCQYSNVSISITVMEPDGSKEAVSTSIIEEDIYGFLPLLRIGVWPTINLYLQGRSISPFSIESLIKLRSHTISSYISIYSLSVISFLVLSMKSSGV